MQFAATTAAITAGAVAERGRVLPLMVFIFFWATLVYCPIACWAWNINGWAFKYGVLDYAGVCFFSLLCNLRLTVRIRAGPLK